MTEGITRDGMVFYRSFYEAVSNLPPDEFKKCVSALLDYGLDGIEPKTDGIEKTVYIMAKPQIDKNNQRYTNGKSGGRKSNRTETKPEPNDNQTVTKHEPKDKVKEKDKVKDKELKKRVPNGTPKETPEEIINQYGFSEKLADKAKEWLRYKAERRETYKPTGLTALLRKISQKAAEYGENPVIILIDECMANGWRGIIWDRLEKEAEKSADKWDKYIKDGLIV